MNAKKYAAEAIGTFWLVLGGCGSAVLAAAFPQVGIGLLGVSVWMRMKLTESPAFAAMQAEGAQAAGDGMAMALRHLVLGRDREAHAVTSAGSRRCRRRSRPSR